MKRVLTVLAVACWGSTVMAASVGPKVIECNFTEPFFDLKLDLQKKVLIKNEPNWDEGGDPTKTSVVAKNLDIEVVPVGQSVQIKAKRKGETLLSLSLNYAGSDGMSEVVSPYSAEYSEKGHDGKLYGGCASETGGQYAYLNEKNLYYPFVQNSGKAIGLCYNRALLGWTSDASKYVPEQTVFYTLYGREIPTGEPGDVSETFSSAEGEELARLVELTKSPAKGAKAQAALLKAKWDYCDYYSSRLNNRIESYTDQPN